MTKPAAAERIYKFFTEDLMLRASAAVTTGIVREICAIQDPAPLGALALGRVLTGALLMASQLREGQQVGVHFNGDGPLGGLFAEANFEGQTRAYCPNPETVLPLKNGKLDLGSAVGKGILAVTRSQPFQKQPHQGITPIVTGEIGDDLAHYLYQSHQIPSIVSLGVYLDPEGGVVAAGGVLIEVMPGADEKLLAKLEERAKNASSLSERLKNGATPHDLVRELVHDSPLVGIEHEYPMIYSCRCNADRVERTLTMLGRAALSEMILKGETVGVNCEFCGKKYSVTVDQLREMLANTSSSDDVIH